MSLIVATFTLMDGEALTVPIAQITGYAEQWAYREDPLNPNTHINTFLHTIIFLSDNREVPVTETGTQVHDAIYNAIDINP